MRPETLEDISLSHCGLIVHESGGTPPEVTWVDVRLSTEVGISGITLVSIVHEQGEWVCRNFYDILIKEPHLHEIHRVLCLMNGRDVPFPVVPKRIPRVYVDGQPFPECAHPSVQQWTDICMVCGRNVNM